MFDCFKKKEVVPTRHQVEDAPMAPPEPITEAPLVVGAYPFLDDALRITGGFEGRGYSQVTGDFDKQGLSLGVLQWNYGQGSLQRVLLAPYLKQFGSIDALGIFPGSVDVTANMSAAQSLSYARKNMLKGTKVKPEWVKAWATFLTRESVIGLQRAGCSGVAKHARTLASEWGYNSRKAFCFFFDIVTQNGSMKSVGKNVPSARRAEAIITSATKTNQEIWKPLLKTASDETLVLFIAGYDRAQISNPTYFQDVFSRKGSIAFGKGHVHGKTWDLFPVPHVGGLT